MLVRLALVVVSGVLRANSECAQFVAEYSSRVHPKALAKFALQKCGEDLVRKEKKRLNCLNLFVQDVSG